MNAKTLAPLLASAQASHAALVTLARASSGAAAEEAWSNAGQAHRIASNLCMLLAVAALERESHDRA